MWDAMGVERFERLLGNVNPSEWMLTKCLLSICTVSFIIKATIYFPIMLVQCCVAVAAISNFDFLRTLIL